ncbi:MAG: DMT family transporter [Candidatus Marinarcus sp.]|uniref:DMT family transporter n=1 Tax=Candidatus Marinarcus sp. TaxID=3100987 RepID=UPI003B00DB09
MQEVKEKPLFLTVYTLLALLFLSANSLLCKLAFLNEGIDPFSFSAIRIFSAALSLFILLQFKTDSKPLEKGNWLAGFMLFLYAITFSYSYVLIDTGIGALILFGVVQIIMITFAVLKKEQINFFKILGAIIAFIGLIYLLLPTKHEQVSLKGALLMAIAGIAWAIYSIIGKKTQHPLSVTYSNFLMAFVFIFILSFFVSVTGNIQMSSFIYALISGAVTSGIGYVLWYVVVTKIETSTASIIQLTVPILATLGGVVFLKETLTVQTIIATVVILSGILLSTISKKNAA